MLKYSQPSENSNLNEKFKEMYLLVKGISNSKYQVNTFGYFGLALWSMQKVQLQCIIRKAISELDNDCSAKNSFEQILHYLENAFVNKEPQSADSGDVDEFCEAVTILCDLARANLVFDVYNKNAMLALDLIFCYIKNMKNGLYFSFPEIDEPIYE